MFFHGFFKPAYFGAFAYSICLYNTLGNFLLCEKKKITQLWHFFGGGFKRSRGWLNIAFFRTDGGTQLQLSFTNCTY